MKLFIGVLCALLAWRTVVAGGEVDAEAGGEAATEAGGEAVAKAEGRTVGEAECGCDYHMEPVCATNERSYANPCIMECAGAKFWKHGGCKQHPHF